jgi:phosphonoacetaldehyde hydrolase
MSAVINPANHDARLQTVIFDLAGTLVDFGSRAPVIAFQRLFDDLGIAVNEHQAREPMGSEKRTHIARILDMPAVQAQWQSVYGEPSNDLDIERLYRIFEPLQLASVAEALAPIPGAIEMLRQLPDRGLRIAFNTGYSRHMAQPVLDALAAAGVHPASVVCGPEVPLARPAPHMALRNLIETGAGAVNTCVKVDDAESGVAEGRNAGMWSVGVAVSGNALGLSLEQWQALPVDRQAQLRETAGQRLQAAGAHYVIDSVAELLPCLDDIAQRLTRGERP